MNGAEPWGPILGLLYESRADTSGFGGSFLLPRKLARMAAVGFQAAAAAVQWSAGQRRDEGHSEPEGQGGEVAVAAALLSASDETLGSAGANELLPLGSC